MRREKKNIIMFESMHLGVNPKKSGRYNILHTTFTIVEQFEGPSLQCIFFQNPWSLISHLYQSKERDK